MGAPNRYNGGGSLAGVVLVDAATGDPYVAGGGSGGAVGPGTAAAAARVTFASDAPTLATSKYQGLIAQGSITLVAGVAQQIIGAFPGRVGMRVLNWTASIVYLGNGITGTPASGAGSDYIPAAVGGVPGQWEPPYAPVDGVRAVGASAGGLTVTVW